ncbi:MAG: HPr(Ser) kinase/phosphatase [Bacteroidetes bacterium]|nr:HPr(Ser) kinase/phosphatase [Bacteroidota bacterium]TDI72235.1 MAG: HPr kinase/phosphorylase [Bacteroidota bacterium]
MARQAKPFKKESIDVEFLIQQLGETVGVTIVQLNDVPLENRSVTESNLHRPGLALAGYLDLFTHHRIQVIGNTETRYLNALSDKERKSSFKKIIDFELPCVFFTENNDPGETLIKIATKAKTPVFQTPLPTIEFMSLLKEFLSDQFALQQAVHGALIDVYGVGLLIKGKPGIGKSEVALDLVERGHRLVADDVVVVTRKEESVLMGAGTDIAQHFMEIRGLGLIDVRAMFGIRAIRFQKRVEVVVHLHPWDSDEEYTRLGMVDSIHEIMGVEIPLVKLPITPGKNVTVLCEVIAMNHLLRNYGYDAAAVFADRLIDKIKEKGSAGPKRGIEYFEHDYE